MIRVSRTYSDSAVIRRWSEGDSIRTRKATSYEDTPSSLALAESMSSHQVQLREVLTEDPVEDPIYEKR